MKWIILTLATLCFFELNAQNIQFQLLEYNSDIPVSFAKITNSDTALIADIDGKFNLNQNTLSFNVRMIGYKDSLIKIQTGTYTYFLYPTLQEEKEVTIVAGENPAHRIIDLAIANRKLNHPLENDAFKYDSYSKFVFGSDPDIIKITDSAKQEQQLKIKNFLENQFLFLNETQAIRTFTPPSRDHEEIIAYKTSGLNNPLFATFAREIQSFNFYDTQFELLGTTYLNPIAAGGTKKYLFILQDSLIRNGDTTFTITYRPRKGKNFEGITGVIYINSNRYAIEKVIASPYEQSEIYNVEITQEYEFVQGYKWFPVNLSTELTLKNNSVDSVGMGQIEGRGTIYVKNIEFNPEKPKHRFLDNVDVSTADNAGDISEEEWTKLRGYELTQKDKNTYRVIDSIGDANNFDAKLTSLLLLAQGKIPFKRYNIDLKRVVNYNEYEGYRFGLGVETSERLTKAFKLSGYFGWATRDKEWKYGGEADVNLYRKRDLKLNMLYQQDIFERGGYKITNDNFNLTSASVTRRFYISKMDRQRIAQVGISGLLLANVKLNLFTNYQRISTTDSSSYINENAVLFDRSYDLAETGFEFIWNIREKVMRLGDLRISKGTNYPKISFLVKKGIKGIYNSSYNYTRFALEIEETIKIKASGTFNWLVQASQTVGDVPLFLMQTPYATGNNWNLSVMNTFETLPASTVYSRRQINLFTRFNFTQFKTNLKWFKPQFFLHHALGFGDFSGKENYNQDGPIHSLEKGYYEAGGGINNLLILGFSGFGMGVFYNYGVYSSPYVKDNLTYKISLKINI